MSARVMQAVEKQVESPPRSTSRGGARAPRRSRPHPIPMRLTSCLACGARASCLRASHLWGISQKRPARLREVLGQLLYSRAMPVTPPLEEGREAHERLAQMRQVETDPRRIVERINRREQFYASATFCSPTFGGIRAQPDAIRVESNGGHLKLTIIEDKTHLEGKYWIQLAAEGVILTDRQALMTSPYVETDTIGGREDMLREPFYDQLQGFETVDVYLAYNPYGSLGQLNAEPLPPELFARNWHIVRRQLPRFWATTRAKNLLLDAVRHPKAFLSGYRQMQTRFQARGRQLHMYVPADEARKLRAKR